MRFRPMLKSTAAKRHQATLKQWRSAQNPIWKPQSGVALREWPLVRPPCAGLLVGPLKLRGGSWGDSPYVRCEHATARRS